MAATGVLPFIRGVDLSGNDFKVRIFAFFFFFSCGITGRVTGFC
uniref:Uncharacterized protein n=1 Tax=Poecilia mexicana TaxID=48701 RepID=A0A3B3XS36_9TELE